MRKKYLVLFLPALMFSCAGKNPGAEAVQELPLGPVQASPAAEKRGVSFDPEEVPGALEELAELERSGGFVPGLGLAESNLREQSADYAGAVLAVFKELYWAHSLGAGDVSRDAIREGLKKLLEHDTARRFTEDAGRLMAAAVPAILAFFDGRWDEAEKLLYPIYGGDTEADGFSRWMFLVCKMEKSGGKEGRSDYGAIRARYMGFPGYWYHAARTAGHSAAAGDYAERCINLAPEGPYAAECRIILAGTMGLEQKSASSLRTRLEIEAAVRTSAGEGNPGVLATLFPLLELPDNPSTLYASGAMRALAGNALFRGWFIQEAEKAKGRLAERLLYISRG